MSMVRCSQCGTAFSSYRTACPNCGTERNKGGARLKKKSGPDARLIITIVLILAVIACIIILATMIFGGKDKTTPETTDPDSSVTDTNPEDSEGGQGSLITPVDEEPDTEPEPEVEPTPQPAFTVDSITLNVQWYSSINGYEVSFVVGETFVFKATTAPDVVDVVWASANPAVITIDDAGNTVAMSRGVTTISATYEDMTVECTVRVN